MKEKLIELIVACDKDLHDVATHESMCSSSSVKEIAEYISKNISNDFVAALMSEIMKQLKDYVDIKITSEPYSVDDFDKYCSMMMNNRYHYSDILDNFVKTTFSVDWDRSEINDKTGSC